MTCSLPVSHKKRVPVIVSLVQEKCEEARNSLKVIYNPLREKEHKQKFAVCSKCLGKVVWSLQFSLNFVFKLMFLQISLPRISALSWWSG